jgi:hypothetical protein
MENAIKLTIIFCSIFLIICCRNENISFSYDSKKSLSFALSEETIEGNINEILIYNTKGGLSDYLSDAERLKFPHLTIRDPKVILKMIKCMRSSCNPIIVESPDKSQKEILHIIIETNDSPTLGYVRFIRDSSNRTIGHIETWHGSDSFYRNSEIGSFLDVIQKK